MAQCDVLYTPEDHRSRLQSGIKIALVQSKGDINVFAQRLNSILRFGNKSEQLLRLAPQATDSESEVVKAMRALLKDINDVLLSWDASHPNSKMRDAAMSEILKALRVEDETQVVAVEEDNDSKTKDEVADKNTASLNDHIAEFYGLEAFDIASSMRQTFEDTIASAAYYDINSGSVREQTNPLLNKNIKDSKAKLFKNIVKYLKQHHGDDARVAALSENMYDEVGRLDTQNYYAALTKFYSLVATDPEFKNKLQTAHSGRVTDVERQDKTGQYTALVQTLEADEHFKKRMDRKFPGGKRLKVKTQLYTADHFSEYYAAVKDYVLKNKPELTPMLEAIEQPNIDILEVANSYTMLRHFDSLLKEVYGDQISIAQGTVGFETDLDTKYSYHQDTAHERKGWQTSEDIGSEKHTSRFTNAVIRMIRIFDYKTGEFMHRRADNTTLIVAARNLINAVLTGKVTFNAESDTAKRALDELKDRIIFFHQNPVPQLQRILELLFEKQPNISQPLVYYMENRQTVNDYDLSVLKSVYDTVFSKNNSQSFYTQSIQATKSFKQATQSLLEEIAGFVDRNVTAAYLETIYDFETGATTVRAKKKFFNTKQLYKTQASINAFVNQMPMADRAKIQDNYSLRVTEDNSTNTRYTVTIGGKDFTLKIPNGLVSQILAKNLNKGTQMSFEVETGLFQKLDNINLVEFRYKVERGVQLTGDEQLLYDVLKFLDDTLDMKILTNPSIGLQTLQSYKQIYNPVDGFRNFLMPLLKLGIRSAYANSMYLKAGEQSLGQYLRDSNDPIYAFHLRDKKSKIFNTRYNNVKYQIASYADDVLTVWTDAQSILNGEASKATTKDKQGNSIPNNSVSKLGGILHYYLGKQFSTNMNSLLFVNDPGLIMETFHDLEVTNMQNESKSVRDFSNGELFYHAIFNKFWGSYLSNGSVIIQPTTYSDKTTFLNWEIRAMIQGLDVTKATPDQIIRLYIDTIGQAYQKSFEHTVDKLKRITEHYARKNNIRMSDYRDIMHLMTEDDLRLTAVEVGVDVELNKDYKIIKDRLGKSVVGVNGTLEYNANLYTDPEALANKLLQERNLFLEQLLFNGCFYQVLEGNDTLDMYTDDKISEEAKSRNPILSTILSMFANDVEGRKAFMNNWVDADTGKLILAKQNGKNIISTSDGFNIHEAMELNPILDKFFYAEGLLSNNLRYSLTGFEVNHPSGKKSPFSLTKIETVDEWNQTVATQNNSRYPVLTAGDWEYFHNQNGTGIFDTALDVDDINRFTATLDPKTTPASVMATLSNFMEDIYGYETNTAQGAQFKRNVIIPATLQYVTQNAKDGVPPKIKCAVIRDTQAHVWNYRGDHEGTIDAADGSAKITPFQSILENRALGSQAVGFIKKPIWHAYDTDSGTAFLAKFATDTITNESMRMSLKSKGPDYNLFKKATNLQWEPTDNIDLTRSLVRDQSFGETTDSFGESEHQTWFKKVILQNGRLFYKDKYGEIIEIVNFKKTTTEKGQVLYYTEERPKKALASDGVTKRYHIFHDEGPNKSIHTTASTWQQALEQLQQYQEAGMEAHTINSLFELHTALGSVYCVDQDGVGSEFNNEVVVNFMCNVGEVADGRTGKNQYISQETYNQPLKKYQIGYLLNNSAVKNGAKNINPEESWLDDSELTYFEVDSDGLGMQMNADHDIVNAELTEFSQVIAATAAYGYTFDNCYEIFTGLAKTAFQASEKVLRATENYLSLMAAGSQNQAASELYDAVGRIILMNQNIKSTENLTNIIMEAVNKVFNKYKDHTKDEVKIPFSDPNIYSDFIATLASVITKSSIKRSHPGSGCVMVPAYNMIQYFELPLENGKVEKLMASDVLRRAQAEYRAELMTFLLGQEGAQPEAFYRRKTVQELETLALEIDNTGAFSKYYTPLEDVTAATRHMMTEYLDRRQSTMPIHQDRSFFMPSDNVEIYDKDGNFFGRVSLDEDLGQYYDFKDGKLPRGAILANPDGTTRRVRKDEQVLIPEGCTYQLSTSVPYNLRPSLIRWQYRDKTDGVVKYKNIFDLSVIRNAYKDGGDIPADQRTRVQDVLHNLHDGIFYDENGVQQEVLEGTLENEAAELVMSNLYKDTFGIGNESLNEVLTQGEDYFMNQIRELHAPNNPIYDLAFLRDNGKHTLITIGEVNLDETVQPEPIKNIVTNEKDEIMLVKGGREIFEVGKWQYTDKVSFNPETKKFESTTEDVSDQTRFRNKDGKVQQRYDYVTQYTVTTKKTDKRRGTVTYQTNTLYKVANVEVFKEAMGNVSDEDALKQQSSIIRKIYSAGDYKLAQINAAKAMSQGKRNAVKNALNFMLGNYHISPEVKSLLRQQLDLVSENTKQNFAEFAKLKEEFMRAEAHKKYVSFLDSLNFISSRIPAQTLQSFMAMKLVGWTENSKNMAYVSHFQTYLQGSDYDIDKAYIMGQSYDSNAIYVRWSPFFDYTSLNTLTASKAIPVPKGVRISISNEGIDLTKEINDLFLSGKIDTITPAGEPAERAVLTTDGMTEAEKLKFLKNFIDLVRKVERANGQIAYNGELNPQQLKVVENTLIRHEQFPIPAAVAEAAYKNVASANIFAVSHDIRNRDQAYTAIAMNLMRKAADNSPKGEQAAKLNMLNPLTKYIMQYQNLVGKDVIGITANGEKFWFNVYYYWTHVLSMGTEEDMKYLQFNQTLNRVQDRGKSKQFEIICSQRTVTHIPDLNIRDTVIKERLMTMFGATEDSMAYRYTDQLISQLLSAATDNAKELILAKINAGTNYAKMYLYLITMGYNLDDIAAFMYSPISEFIDSRSATNMFQLNGGVEGPQAAINAAQGKVNGNAFLHGSVTEYDPEQDTTSSIKKTDYVAYMLRDLVYSNEKLSKEVYKALNMSETDSIESVKLDELMRAVIESAVVSPRCIDSKEDMNLLKLVSSNGDAEISNYLRYCQDLIQQLRGVKSQYGNKYNELLADAKEFKKIYELASEMSSIASGYLGLNQGLPTDKLSILKRINSMRKVVTDRETAMEIREWELYGEAKDEMAQARQLAAWDKVITNLMENNPDLDEDTIREALDNAHEAGIMNHFDVVRMLTDDTYKQIAKDYLHVIKGTANVIDMMDKIPHYREIMSAFRTLLVADKAMAMKSRLIDQLIQEGKAVNDQQLKGILRYVDQLNIVDFLDTEGCPVLTTHSSVQGFDAKFNSIMVNSFDLSTPEGVAGFKHFVESEFYSYLKEAHSSNPLVRHLTKIVSEGRTVLSTDIDLLNPNVTAASRLAYDEILRGTALFEGVRYNEDYTIADILQLYNLIINSNQYGGERFTTMFKVCSNPNSILEKYLRYTAARDYDSLLVPEYNKTDYDINAAPVVSPSAKRFQTAPFIKVKDPIWDYVLMKRVPEINDYVEYPLLPAFTDEKASAEERMQRRINFAENYPFEMPNRSKVRSMTRALNYNGEVTPEVLDVLRTALADLSMSGKIILTKIC